MDELKCATITFENGVAEDSRGKFRNNRQVTVLAKECWDKACSELEIDMPWTTRRANLFIEGIELKGTAGSKLQIGDVTLEITGELDPCNRMDEQFEGLTNVLSKDWRGGVTCKILSEGLISTGDAVNLVAT